jgi:uncharacterized phage-like protein YoqJ
VIPFSNHAEKFTAGQKKRYEEILSRCTHKEIINNHYSPVAYKRLNYFLVDKTQYLIAVYDQDKSERSGLVQMVNYAIKNNRTKMRELPCNRCVATVFKASYNTVRAKYLAKNL